MQRASSLSQCSSGKMQVARVAVVDGKSCICSESDDFASDQILSEIQLYPLKSVTRNIARRPLRAFHAPWEARF